METSETTNLTEVLHRLRAYWRDGSFASAFTNTKRQDPTFHAVGGVSQLGFYLVLEVPIGPQTSGLQAVQDAIGETAREVIAMSSTELEFQQMHSTWTSALDESRCLVWINASVRGREITFEDADGAAAFFTEFLGKRLGAVGGLLEIGGTGLERPIRPDGLLGPAVRVPE